MIPNLKYILSFSVVSLYFLFQLIFLSLMISVYHECMYVKWLHGAPELSMFWGFTISVILLLFVGIFAFFLEKKKTLKDYAFYTIFATVLLAWLYGMNGMWQTFEFEKGEIDKLEYYGQEFVERNFYEGRKTYECNRPNN